MTRIVTLIICIGLVVGGALVHGSATHRWNTLTPAPERSQKVHQHVLMMGDFVAEDVPSELPVKERSQVTSRRYYSKIQGRMFVVSVTSGPPGAVSTHTPDVCYPGSGYTTLREPTKETIELPNGAKATYMVADYEKKTATNLERHRIRWSWSVQGEWNIPDRPRFAYLAEQELYKLYIVTPLAEGETQSRDADNPAMKTLIGQVFQQYSDLLR